MKIDRLLGILTILLKKEKVTAPYLAEKFEVSRRTINRDIEDICKAGIPIVTTQGSKGGISIAPGYTLDKSLLKKEEWQAILIGLKGLNSVVTSEYAVLVDKFSNASDMGINGNEDIRIDLASHYKNSLGTKIALLRQAIREKRLVNFLYYGKNTEGVRQAEPYYITYQYSGWYFTGYCMLRKEFRTFKLNRLEELIISDIYFIPRELPEKRYGVEQYFTKNHIVKLRFDKSVKYRLIDEYGAGGLTEEPEGSLIFQTDFTDKDYMTGWILSFGSKAEVLEPEELRLQIKNLAQEIEKKYKKPRSDHKIED